MAGGSRPRRRGRPADLDYDHLHSVSAISSTDVWAVGYYDAGIAYLPLVLHWDGTAWMKIPAPAADSNTDVFYGVAAVAPDDVWAVGCDRWGGVCLT